MTEQLIWPAKQNEFCVNIVPGLSVTFSLNNDKTEAYLSIADFPSDNFDCKTALAGIKKIASELFKYGLREESFGEGLFSLVKRKLPIWEKGIASGLQPQKGIDTIIEYHVARPSRECLVRTDGTVDFKNRGLFRSVTTGDKIVTRHPPQPGIPGITVFNTEIPPPVSSDLRLIAGKNVELQSSETGETVAVSTEAGQVVYDQGSSSLTVQVVPVLTIRGDVDFSTGNINHKGSVVINGSVLAGFSVVVTGNLTIHGLIEPGARVTTGGDLVVSKGILGNPESKTDNADVRAFGSIHAKYAENAVISATGDIFLVSAMNCEISTNAALVIEKNLIGGSVKAFKRITVREAGNPASSKTVLSCGISHSLVARLNLVVKVIETTREQHELNRKNLVFVNTKGDKIPLEKLGSLKAHLLKKDSELEDQLLKLELKKADLAIALLEENRARVFAKRVFPGVIIEIRSSRFVVESELEKIVFYQKLPQEIVTWEAYDP